MILVVAEQQAGRLNRASLEAIAGAQQIGSPITVVLPGANVAVIACGRALGFIDNPFVQLAGVVVFTGTFYILTSRMVFTKGNSLDRASDTKLG